MNSATAWYHLTNVKDVATPGLLVNPELVEQNVLRMLEWVDGEPSRLCPHVKTHKLPQIIRLQLNHGIRNFKVATLAEAEMVARCGADSVLVAHQPVGPNVIRLAQLAKRIPDTEFGTIADDPQAVHRLAESCQSLDIEVPVLIDLNVGMNRTGIEISDAAEKLYLLIDQTAGLRCGGLHAYDGHIEMGDPNTTKTQVEHIARNVMRFRERLISLGLPVPRIVAGGTTTSPFHAQFSPDIEVSAGTTVLWDAGQSTKQPASKFQSAAILISRVISKPTADRICLDLGHKSVASEMPHPRVHWLGIGDYRTVGHSEEHLVIETPRASEFLVGDVMYGIPTHICPTVALHQFVITVENQTATGKWRVIARDREPDFGETSFAT